MPEAHQRDRENLQKRGLLRALRALRLLLLLTGPAACAPKVVPAPVVTCAEVP